ncbi:hypothetical protein [Costertonia aggregata]|uniref:Fibronectin type-III domain-containing protein n=1 Tax=Costertonia aggregata TaxID=343403 RepID=A0A7H9AN28_9FLAO|nr:hypothetical protein [Costertonia aggregata]QLG44838.1 hypothetical protein HYG79_05550 [Costertonia aggregata]
MKQVYILVFVLVFIGCKKDPPSPPGKVALVFPEQNSECTTGESINDTQSQVEFRWNASPNTDTYVVRVTNLNTNTTEPVTISATSVRLTLEKGGLYSWNVTSENSQVTETTTSDTWRFYNAGAQTTYPPFPAQILFPGSGETVLKDINNEITLDWSGADIDNDIASFEVYFSTTSPPQTLVNTQRSSTQHRVSVTSRTTYFWRIVTVDTEGNSSDSGVFDFKVD